MTDSVVEVWKDIEGYNGVYKVSNLGRVARYGKPIYITQHKNGYLSVRLTKNRVQNRHLIHRLVATAFIPNTVDFPEVNHKDEVKTNNCVDNLEWCTKNYNMNYSSYKQRKPIIQCDTDGFILATFPSVKSTKEVGFSPSCVSRCCLGELKTHKGYVFMFEEDIL